MFVLQLGRLRSAGIVQGLERVQRVLLLLQIRSHVLVGALQLRLVLQANIALALHDFLQIHFHDLVDDRHDLVADSRPSSTPA